MDKEPAITRTTKNNFAKALFKDKYGSVCSMQESSLATEDAIWLGVEQHFTGRDSDRMHLTREHVKTLLPYLKRFIETGELFETMNSEEVKEFMDREYSGWE